MLKSIRRKCLVVVGALTLSIGLVGCGGQGGGLNPEIAGVKGPNVELLDGRFLLSMAFANLNVSAGITIPIPKYPNSSLSIGPDFETDGMLVVLTVAVEDFVNIGDRGLDPQKLPGGRPLPGVASGQLPAIALRVPEILNSVLYVGPKVIGFFVPFKGLDLAGQVLSFRFHDKAGVRVGNISLVGQDQQKQNGGILVLINIDQRISTAMKMQLAGL
jgi:hypothetical protein